MTESLGQRLPSKTEISTIMIAALGAFFGALEQALTGDGLKSWPTTREAISTSLWMAAAAYSTSDGAFAGIQAMPTE